MVFSLEHDIKVTKNHQNLLPTQSVLVAHTVHTYGENAHFSLGAMYFSLGALYKLHLRKNYRFPSLNIIILSAFI
jgi:hypothetical protein